MDLQIELFGWFLLTVMALGCTFFFAVLVYLFFVMIRQEPQRGQDIDHGGTTYTIDNRGCAVLDACVEGLDCNNRADALRKGIALLAVCTDHALRGDKIFITYPDGTERQVLLGLPGESEPSQHHRFN
nr:Unknown Function [uncultured bacterium]AIA19039.1 Unknown Function [uncultured bacterium]